jgi:hypothetical protein
MARLAIIALAILPLAATACTHEGEEQVDGGTEPLVADMEIGVAVDGSEGFLLVDDGDDAQLASGAQGGFHVWTAPRFKGAAGTLYLDRRARRVEDQVLVLRASRLVIDVPEDAMESWWRDEQAIPSFMCPPPIGIQIFDAPIEFTFELRTEDEELIATDTLIVTPRCAEGATGDYCRSTCAG